MDHEIEPKRSHTPLTFSSIFQEAPLLIGIVELTDDDIIHVEANQATADFIGLPVELLRGRGVRELGTSDSEQIVKWRAQYLRSKESGRPVRFEEWSKGHFLAVAIHALPDSGSAPRFCYYIHDLTEYQTRIVEKRAKLDSARLELIESENRFGAIFDHAAVGIAQVNLDGTLARVNQVFSDITGYSSAELRNMTFQQITHPEDLEKDLALAGQLFRGEISTYSINKRYIKKDGASTWIRLTGSAVRGADGQARYGIAVIEDINEKTQLAQRLADREHQLKMSLTASNIVAWDWCPATNRVEFVFNAEEVYGSPIGSVADFFSLVHAEDCGQLRNDLELALHTGSRTTSMFRIIRPDNHKVRWIEARITTLNPRDGTPVRLTGICIDITAHKEAADAIEAAFHTQDELFSTASHELKTPVTALSLHLQMLEDQIAQVRRDEPAMPKLKKFAEIARRQMKSLMLLIDNLLDQSRINLGQFNLNLKRISVDGFLNEVIDRFEVSLRRAGCHLEKDLRSGAWIQADAVKLEQVIVNVLSNVVKYAPNSTLHIIAGIAEGQCEIRLHDSGPGIAREHQERIFEKKVHDRQRKAGHGMGIGLYISRQIVQRLGGDMAMESGAISGTSFIIRLPLSNETP